MTTNATQIQNAAVSFSDQSDAANGLALVRVTIGAMFVWVFFENLGKGLYTAGGLCGADQLLHQGKSLASCMESGYGPDGKPCGDGRSHAGATEISMGILLVYWFAHAAGCVCRIPVPRQPLDVGIGHVVDLGATGSGARLARTRDGTRRTCLGHRCVAGTAAPRVPWW